MYDNFKESSQYGVTFLSYTYTSIALDTRLLTQPYQTSQIELSSPAIQNSCRGLIRGLIQGPIFSCSALPRSRSRPGEKKLRKWTYSCIFYLIPTKIRLKTPLKALKYPLSYTEYLHTKWRQRQTFERHNVTTTSKTRATFLRTLISQCRFVVPCNAMQTIQTECFFKYCQMTL